MPVDDRRSYIQFYGVKLNEWSETFGSFANHTYILIPDYISDGNDTTDDTAASGTHKFLYPEHVKKKYWIEGRVEGEFCLAASGATSHVTDYRVTVCKVHDNGTETELVTTGWKTVDDDLAWDTTYEIGDEEVYHYWIDAFEEQELSDEERIYLKIQVTADANCIIMHSNDPEWTDVWVEIPFRL